MTIFWHPTGPLMKVEGDTLTIEDLNPQLSARWRMSRWERIRTGWRFLLSAMYG